MTFIRTRSVKALSQVFGRMLLLLTLSIQIETLTMTADAQSHNVDGTFLVEARVNGYPAILMLDTGAEHSLLDRDFAQRLGLRPVAVANIDRPSSLDKTEIVLVHKLEIPPIYSNDLQMMTDDLTASSVALGVHIDGALGNDLLRKFTVTLDYFAGSVKFDRKSIVHHGIPIKLGRIDNRYVAHLNFDGVPLMFLLDTGTNFSVLSQSGWQKLNQKKTALPLIDGVRTSGTSATSKLICVHEMAIGGISTQNLPMRVHPPTFIGFFADPEVDGLLGSDFLRQFVVVLDLANDTLYLRQDHNFKADRNRFSTIGIQFVKDATGFFTVMAVWSPTPASEASFEVGDQVLSVNGVSTIGMTQEDLSSQLHGEPGRKIQVGILSGGNQRTASLAMRNIVCQSPLIVTR
jgi:predicted aspartyl protease